VRAARPLQTPILAQGFEQSSRQRHQAWAIALAVSNVDETGLAVDVADFECKDLGNAQPCTVGGHHDHAVLERLDLA